MVAQVRLVNFADPSDVLIFPITPAELPESADATVKSFNVIGKGQHSFPDGRGEYKFTITGYFPGQGRYSPENLYRGQYEIGGHLVHEMVSTPSQGIVGRGDNLPHIHDWRHPEELVFQLREWLKNKAKLRYVADSMAGLLQVPVFLNSYSFTKRGWAGDIAYSLSFTEWRTLSVFIDDGSASGAGSASTSGTSSDSTAGEQGDEEDANPTSYTVQEGDNLTFIAKRFLGDGGRWPEIYDLNRDTIGDNPSMIYPGQELLIPGGTVAEPNQDGYAPMGAEATQESG